jgi:hypothetical protein
VTKDVNLLHTYQNFEALAHMKDSIIIRITCLIWIAVFTVFFQITVEACVICFPYPNTGIDEIEALYFGNKDRTLDELEEVCKAFSVLGSEGGIHHNVKIIHRRYRIVRSYSILLKNHPVMAGQVAKDLTIWKIQALVECLSNIIENESMLHPSAIFAVKYYLSMAHRFPKK